MATYFATQLLSIATLIAFTPPTQADYQSLNVPTGITEVNGTDLNETSAQLPGPSLPQCVDVSTNSGWLSLSGPISGQDCVQVLADIQSASNGSEGTPYLFYSEQVYPSGPPHTEQDWKLPIGAETTFSRGSCVGVVRMHRDFISDALPLENGNDLATGGYPTQVANWSSIIDEFEAIITTCVSGSSPRKNGWGKVGDIIVAMWPRNSQIDQLYGFYTSGVPSRNASITNVTEPVDSGDNSAVSVVFTSVAGAPTPTASFTFGSGSGSDQGTDSVGQVARE